MKHVFLRGTALSIALLMSTPATFADDNAVYVGQSGTSNLINVDQAGDYNKVGADKTSNTDARAIFQDGLDNELNIDQYGANNRVGAEYGFVENGNGVLGVNQTGSRNLIQIDQENHASSGKNVVISILQQAASTSAQVRNKLNIIQTSEEIGGDIGGTPRDGNHRIGEISQIHDGETTEANEIDIQQYDGAAGDRNGNEVDIVHQLGSGNKVLVVQQFSGNKVFKILQTGFKNTSDIAQNFGTGNVINDVEQIGDNNSIDVSQAGTENIIISIAQLNEELGSYGNLVTVTLAGDHNGGNGFGDVGHFVSSLTQAIPIGQAEIKQLGDHNTLNYMTDSGSEGNLFAFLQIGNENFISGIVEGEENEVAISLEGDGNVVNFNQNGKVNIIAVEAYGSDNHLNVEQVSTLNDGAINNTVEVLFDKRIFSKSSHNNDTLTNSFVAEILAVASGLVAGDIKQFGDNNSVKIEVNGSYNMFAMSQTGYDNDILLEIEGFWNQSLITQNGSFNTASLKQIGNNNIGIITQ